MELEYASTISSHQRLPISYGSIINNQRSIAFFPKLQPLHQRHAFALFIKKVKNPILLWFSIKKMGGVHGRYCWLCFWHRSSSSDKGDSFRVHDHEEAHVLSATVPSHNLVLKYAFLTQKGYYPDSPERENQDSFCVTTHLQGNPNLHFFGVFDGHGEFGARCADFVKERLVGNLANDPRLSDDPENAYISGFLMTNRELHESEINDTLSGTTAITVLVRGDTLYVANVGDSRAIAGVWNGNSIVAEDLSCDQTPFRKDEYERVKRCGARVLSVGQINGLKDPDVQNWDEDVDDKEDPPRLWVQNGMYPGTAFTRSVGDSIAEGIGAIVDPEILTVKITPDHLFFVIASDGVFEFLSSQDVVNMVSNYSNPGDACVGIVAESYRKWQELEGRVDDITVIVVQIKDIACNVGTSHHYIKILKKVFCRTRKY